MTRRGIFLANGALAFKLMEAGCRFATSRPGTPSSGILPEVIRPALSKKACLVVDADPVRGLRPKVNNYLQGDEGHCHRLPASPVAQESGYPVATNPALLGFFPAFEDGSLTAEELKNAIEKIPGDRFREENLPVFDTGHARGPEVKGH